MNKIKEKCVCSKGIVENSVQHDMKILCKGYFDHCIRNNKMKNICATGYSI